jgi:decaprenyl-phosphate phosphoribosyltransferase
MHPADADALPLVAPRRGSLQAILTTARPRQWIKNALVIAAAGAAGALGHDDVPVRVGLACLAFCLLSSGIYAVNDVCDAPEDRLHPVKCRRPVAAGELDPRTAAAVGGAVMAVGLALCADVAPLLVLVGGAYLALTLTYTLVWRHVLVLDVVAIAGGFVLRAVAGGVTAPVALSLWFLLVVTGGAVFVAAAKRYAELRRVDARRPVLDSYTPELLHAILVGSAAVAMLAYLVWAFQLPAVRGVPWRALTAVPFAACLLRYGALVSGGVGESPEDVLLSDRVLQLAGLTWLIMFALEVHAAS